MRPPQSATPPISHMIPGISRVVTHDWSALTSDNSVQILHLDSADNTYNETLFGSCDVVKRPLHVKAEQYNSPSPIHNVSSYYSNRSIDAEIESSLTRVFQSPVTIETTPKITVTARMFFDPSSEIPTPFKVPCFMPETLNSYQQCARQMTRHTYSDSDIHFGHDSLREEKFNDVNIKRSKSLGFADCESRNQSTAMLRPLRPCMNQTKVGKVKQLTCNGNMTPVPEGDSVTKESSNISLISLGPKSDRKLKTKDRDSRKYMIKNTESLSLPSVLEAHKIKLSGIVKSGLKNILKCAESFDVKKGHSQSRSVCQTLTKKNSGNRSQRKNSEIGGLSEFLRKINQRKKLTSFPVDVIDNKEAEGILVQDNVVTRRESFRSFDKPGIKTFLKCTPKPWSGQLIENKSLATVGELNMKFAKCQRKLVFSSDVNDNIHGNSMPKENLPKNTNANQGQYDSKTSDEGPINNISQIQQPCRPKLGILGRNRPLTFVPIDDLGVDVVTDLKRCLGKGNGVSRIKTNGSLLRPRMGQVLKQAAPSPRRCSLTRGNRVASGSAIGARRARVKRESVV